MTNVERFRDEFENFLIRASKELSIAEYAELLDDIETEVRLPVDDLNNLL